MNVNVISTTDNKLLERKEVVAEVAFDGPTPKRAEIKQAIGGKIGANPEAMVLRDVSSSFGTKTIKVVAHLYATKDKLMATEPEHIKVREGLMEKKKKVKAPAVKKQAKK